MHLVARLALSGKQPQNKEVSQNQEGTSGPPQRRTLPREGARPTLRVSAVAERLGVAAATLRTWDRRYGLGPSEHAAGSHRQYSWADFERLTTMRRLTQQGMAPAEAARVALAQDVTGEVAPAPSPVTNLDPSAASTLKIGPIVDRLDQIPDAARPLVRAAARMDSSTIRQVFSSRLAASGVCETWEELAMPALQLVGEHWAQTGQGVEVEHLLTNALMCSLADYRHRLGATRGLTLLASADEDQHDLPLHAAATGMAEYGLRSALLGARMPHSALLASMRSAQPDVLVLLALIQPVPGQVGQLAGLAEHTRLILAGPGWHGVGTPKSAVTVNSLPVLVDHVRLAIPR